MTIQSSALEEVKREIEKFLQQLKLGMDEVSKLTARIMQSLHENKNMHVTTDSLRNDKDLQKELRTTCLSHVLQKDLSFKFDPNLLMKTPNELQKDELKNSFKEFLKKMFKLTPKNKKKLDPNKQQEALIDQFAEILTTELTNKKENVRLGDNKQAMGIIASCVDTLTASIQKDYGGKDVRFSDSPAVPITSTSEDISTQNLATADGTSFKASLKQETGEDPMGIKIFNILGDIADGKPLPSADEMKREGILAESSFNPRLKPPGAL